MSRNRIEVKNGHAEIVLVSRDGREVGRAIVDTTDIPAVAPYRWRLIRSKVTSYARGRLPGDVSEGVFLHRLLLPSDQGVDIDHKDGNGLNNRRDNLRRATRSENLQNRHGAARGSRSGIRGVDFFKGRWRARGQLRGKSYCLGYFETSEEASTAVSRWRSDNMPFTREVRASHPVTRAFPLALLLASCDPVPPAIPADQGASVVVDSAGEARGR